jgi:hypothetical protein
MCDDDGWGCGTINERLTRGLWIVTTAIVSVMIMAVFVSGRGTMVDLRVPVMLAVTALLGLSSGIAAIIYTGVFVQIRRRRSKHVPYRQTSWWHLVFWALVFSTSIIAMPVGIGSITLDLPTGLVFVLAVILSSGGLWVQHGFVISGRGGYAAKDERTDRVQGKAAIYVLFISIGVIIELLVYEAVLASSLSLPELSGSAVLILLLAAIFVSYTVLHWHLNRRDTSG